jgi:hypothetical protein
MDAQLRKSLENPDYPGEAFCDQKLLEAACVEIARLREMQVEITRLRAVNNAQVLRLEDNEKFCSDLANENERLKVIITKLADALEEEQEIAGYWMNRSKLIQEAREAVK